MSRLISLKASATSQWAGYFASIFAIAFFVTGTIFRQTDGKVPSWLPVVIGWLMMLAAFSGVVCLVSAFFGFVRQKRKCEPSLQEAKPPGM